MCVEFAEIGKADPKKTIIFGNVKLARFLDLGVRCP
jgi:hypothetical protein